MLLRSLHGGWVLLRLLQLLKGLRRGSGLGALLLGQALPLAFCLSLEDGCLRSCRRLNNNNVRRDLLTPIYARLAELALRGEVDNLLLSELVLLSQLMMELLRNLALEAVESGAEVIQDVGSPVTVSSGVVREVHWVLNHEIVLVHLR